MADILNMEFRDMAAQASYPFTTSSSLASESGQILDVGLILDALFYPVAPREAPFYLYSIRGPVADEARIRITVNDNSFLQVGTCLCDTASDTAMCLDENGRIVGVLVYAPALMLKLADTLAMKEVFFSKDNAQFISSVAFCPAVAGTVGVKSAASYYTGAVNLVAASGMTWAASGSAYSLNLYGEMRTLRIPVRSINSISADHFWIASYPGKARSRVEDESSSSGSDVIDRGSDLRVVTKQEGAVPTIVIGKGRDFSYGE